MLAFSELCSDNIRVTPKVMKIKPLGMGLSLITDLALEFSGRLQSFDAKKPHDVDNIITTRKRNTRKLVFPKLFLRQYIVKIVNC